MVLQRTSHKPCPVRKSYEFAQRMLLGKLSLGPRPYSTAMGYAQPLGPNRMHRILIVEDDDAMRELIRAHLEDTYEITDTGDSECVVAGNGQQ